MASTPAPHKSLGNLVFLVILSGFAAMILSVPVFPTQDGPLHLYHAEVFGSLLRGGDAYAETFRITRLLPPYSFFTYAVLALNTIFEPQVSEKLLVCAYLIWFCFSFRFLVHSVQPGNFVVPLFAFPLAMHRLAYMGFYNFIFGVATALFLSGFWIRHHAALSGWRSWCVVLLFAAITLTHPLGLLAAIGFVAIHIVTGLACATYRSAAQSWTARLGSALREHRRQLAHLAIVPLALGWVAMFTYPSQLVELRTESHETMTRAVFLLAGWVLSPLQALGYRALLLAAIALILLLAYRSFDELGAHARDALPLLVMGLGCMAAYFIVSAQIYFPDRFPILAIPFLAAFAGARNLSGRPAVALTLVVAAISVAVLAQQTRMVRSAVPEIEPLLSAPVASGSRVVITADTPYEATESLMFSPYYWAGAHYARRSQGFVVNAAWLSPTSPVVMFTTRHPRPWDNRNPFPMAEYLRMHRAQLPPATALVACRFGRPLGGEDSLAALLGLKRRVFATAHLVLYTK